MPGEHRPWLREEPEPAKWFRDESWFKETAHAENKGDSVLRGTGSDPHRKRGKRRRGPDDVLAGKSEEHQQSPFNLNELSGRQAADSALHV